MLNRIAMACLALFGFGMCSPTLGVADDTIKFSYSGFIQDQGIYHFLDDDNIFNPNNEILDFPEWTNNFYGKLNLGLSYSFARVVTQFRPSLTTKEGDSTTFKFIVDDAYLDLNIRDTVFLFAGKRNIRDGVAYGANPTDFLGEGKEVDSSKREEERRVEREGNYIVGGDIFLANLTVTALYAPKIEDLQDEKDRYLLKGSILLESIKTDASLHLFSGDIPGAGSNISGTIGDHLVLYAECAARWGSDKREIRITSAETAMAPRVYDIVDPDDKDTVYPQAAVGGSYTFGDGTGVIAEYIYNGSGYGDTEWQEIIDYLTYNNDNYVAHEFPGPSAGGLAEGNSIMQFRKMRKNYAFLRISNAKLIENVDAQIAFMMNLDDSSYLVNPSVDYKIITNLTVGVSLTYFSGDKDSEFGMMYWSTEVGANMKYSF